MTDNLRDALIEALPKVGEPEDVWCTVHASTLRAALAALAQPAASPETPNLSRKLRDVSCRMHSGETLFRDHELVDEASDALKAALDGLDEVLIALDLDPEQFRTDGGAINRGKLRAAILHPSEYLPESHWLRAQPAASGEAPSDDYRRGFADGVKALESDVVSRLSAAHPPVAPEPDMRHPKIQRLIGAKARREIELQLVEQLLEDPECDLTSLDMEYWGPMHDRLKAALTAPEPVAALTDARDAARYRWLRDRLMSVDWDYMGTGETALIFTAPPHLTASADADATIDSAMRTPQPKEQT